MELQITPELRIADVQQQFSLKYPHLKLEFYMKPHEEGEGSEARYKVDESLTIRELTGNKATGEVHVHGNMKTSTLEDEFEKNMGLYVQVFRKSGKIWLQTTKTDSWTLAEQERTAAEMG